MKKQNLATKALVFIAALSLSLCSYAQSKPKNILVFISDGWGYNHIAATNYWNGVDSTSFQKFPTYYPMSTYSSTLKKVWEDTITGYTTGYNSYKAWTDWEWMKRDTDGGQGATGSAPAATTMASGYKSATYAIGVDVDSNYVKLITERAIELGKKAGIVSSVQFSHATPAGFSAHNGSRKAYDEIARSQFLDSKLSVIMGCGNPEYDDNAQGITPSSYKYVGGVEAWDSLKVGATTFSVPSPSGVAQVQDVDGDGNPDAWTLITDSADFAALSSGTTPKRVVGVPKVGQTLQYNRSGDLLNSNPYEIPLNTGIPNLSQMTTAALNVLDNNDGEEGFFLMVEGGAVDWAGHGNSLSRIIEEQADFNNAVDSAIAWLDAAGELDNTLIIVTGDHETGYLVGPNFDINNLDMVNQYAVTDSGAAKMPGYQFMSNEAYGPGTNTGEHTNQLVPFYAKGPGAEKFSKYADQEDFVHGKYIDNTDMGHVLFDLWNDEPMPEPKNFILLISDGWSLNHLLASNYYNGTTEDFQAWDEYYMSTYSATLDDNQSTTSQSYSSCYNPAKAWMEEDWVKRDGGAGATGSGAAATAMYTGVKTAKMAIGVDLFGKPLQTFCERAAETGKSTGVVSSVEFSHATPAAMFAHNNSRNNYSDIAIEMLLDSKASVIMGCGAPDYDDNAQASTSSSYKYVGGEGTWKNILDGAITYDSTSVNGNRTVQDVDGDDNPDAWTVVRDSMEFVNLATGTTPVRVLGIPKVYQTLQYNRTNNDTVAYADAFNSNVPTLADMTSAALNILDNNSNGFSIMIEGGAVDWAGHGNDLDGVIEEQDDFNEAVDAAVKWVNDSSSWDETLVIVTGDHETGYLVGPNWDGNNIYATYEISDAGKGEMPGGQFLSGDHTNMLIPFYVKGAGSEVLGAYADHHDFYRKSYLDNTEIGQGIFKMWKGLPNAKPAIRSSSVVSSSNEIPKATNSLKVFPNPVVSDVFSVEVEQNSCLT